MTPTIPARPSPTCSSSQTPTLEKSSRCPRTCLTLLLDPLRQTLKHPHASRWQLTRHRDLPSGRQKRSAKQFHSGRLQPTQSLDLLL